MQTVIKIVFKKILFVSTLFYSRDENELRNGISQKYYKTIFSLFFVNFNNIYEF